MILRGIVTVDEERVATKHCVAGIWDQRQRERTETIRRVHRRPNRVAALRGRANTMLILSIRVIQASPIARITGSDDSAIL